MITQIELEELLTARQKTLAALKDGRIRNVKQLRAVAQKRLMDLGYLDAEGLLTEKGWALHGAILDIPEPQQRWAVVRDHA